MVRSLSTRRAGARPLPLALLLLLVVVAALTSPVALLMLAPALAILVPLLAGRAPGERLLLRWRRRVPAPRRRDVRFVATGRFVPFVRRIGRMSASALAMRPPPARLLSFR